MAAILRQNFPALIRNKDDWDSEEDATLLFAQPDLNIWKSSLLQGYRANHPAQKLFISAVVLYIWEL